MKFQFRKTFVKQYKRLSEKNKDKVERTLLKFEENPRDRSLNLHVLQGNKKRILSINVGGDMRILFREEGGFMFIEFLEVGTHSQLYK